MAVAISGFDKVSAGWIAGPDTGPHRRPCSKRRRKLRHGLGEDGRRNMDQIVRAGIRHALVQARSCRSVREKIPQGALSRLHEMSFTHAGANLVPPRMTASPSRLTNRNLDLSKLLRAVRLAIRTRQVIKPDDVRIGTSTFEPEREECCTIILLALCKTSIPFFRPIVNVFYG